MVRRVTLSELTGLSRRHANFVVEYCKDFEARRAAVASGLQPDSGYEVLKRDDVTAAIDAVLQSRLEASHIDAEWALMEAVDNHYIARQTGNITASNTALNMIMKHTRVDAYAATRVEVATDAELAERLRKGRARVAGAPEQNDAPAASQDDTEEVSFL